MDTLPILHVRWIMADPSTSLLPSTAYLNRWDTSGWWDFKVEWMRLEVFKTRISKSDQYNIKMCISKKIHFLEEKIWSWQESPYSTIGKCRRFGGNSCFQLQGWKSMVIGCQTTRCHVSEDYNLTVTAVRSFALTAVGERLLDTKTGEMQRQPL